MKLPRNWDDVNGTAHITQHIPAPTLTGTDDQARTLELVARYVEAATRDISEAGPELIELIYHLNDMAWDRRAKMKEQGE